MRGRVKITAPEIICLYDEMTERTIAFLQDLHSYSRAYRVVEIDFSNTVKITTLASLVLLAHLHYIQLYKRNKRAIILNYSRSEIAESFFENTSFQAAFSAGCYDGNGKPSVVFPFKTYSASSISECRKMVTDYLASFKNELKQVLLQKYTETDINQFFNDLLLTITELLQNINHHAYPVDKSPFIGDNDSLLSRADIFQLKLFWCILWYDDREHRIVFALYDLGSGLLTSYLTQAQRPPYEIARLAKLTRIQIFKELLSAGSSRFFGQGRGNGLDAIFNTSMKLSDISLVLLSEEIRCDRRIIGCQYTHFRNSLPGTAAEWNFKLSV